MIRRLWIPIGLSVLVIALHGRVPAVTDASGRGVAAIASLTLPASYVVTSPLSRVLDALTLLSAQQTVWTLLAAALIAVFVLARRRGASWRRWLLRFFGIVVAFAIVEAAVALCPRPMAALAARDPNTVIVDFHSHTGSSHDVRKSFGSEDNRDWHRGGGFDIAWITDHVKFGGAVSARMRNPRIAGEGTSLLTGVEGRYHKIMSTIMLGLDERDTLLLNKRGNLLPGNPARGAGPVTIVALPNRNLDSVTVESLDSIPHFVAIELIDAAPRGLAQFDREEERIRGLAAKLNFTLVAASNNHGFGRTVAAWNLVTIPGWSSQPPDSVGGAIEHLLRMRDTSSVTILMRTRPRTRGAALPLTLPVIAYQTMGSLTRAETFAWLAWVWGVTLLVAFRTRSARQSRRAAT